MRAKKRIEALERKVVHLAHAIQLTNEETLKTFRVVVDSMAADRSRRDV